MGDRRMVALLVGVLLLCLVALLPAGAYVIERVSVTSSGTQGSDASWANSLSADGRYVVFESLAPLVAGDTNNDFDIYIRDHLTGTLERASAASDGSQANSISEQGSISADGRYVAFYSNANNLVAGDTNSSRDIFVRDRQTGQTTRVSVASGGTQAN